MTTVFKRFRIIAIVVVDVVVEKYEINMKDLGLLFIIFFKNSHDDREIFI